ncbi:shikimate dehydrogenase (NADP(+)) [Clostridia bacterium]|nr:shikimate dehydrogenase (NADP(+)) [Clostridia bacterium]
MYTLIGHPLSHSLSPRIHKLLFEIKGRTAEYSLTDIENLDAIDLRQFDGFNITIPHKKTVMSYLDDYFAAKEYGSVNCVVKRDEKLYGYNTDVYGFLGSIPQNICKGDVLMFGFGGAGVMVANEVKKSGGKLTIVCRKGKSFDVAKGFVTEQTNVVLFSDEMFDEQLNLDSHYDILINTTPVGMFPNTNATPTTEKVVKTCDFVYDMIYNPSETKLLKIASNLNIAHSSGLKMLVLQAAKSHEIWFGTEFSSNEIFKIQQDCEKVLHDLNTDIQ